MAMSNGHTEQAFRKPTPDPERDDRVKAAMQYMLATRRKATPVNGDVPSPALSPAPVPVQAAAPVPVPERRKESVLSSAARENIASGVTTTKNTLNYYEPWKDLDGDVLAVFEATAILYATLRQFLSTVGSDGIANHESAKSALEAVESCKDTINSLIPRILSTESSRLPDQLTDPDTPLQELKAYRKGMVDSFRQRTRVKLRHTVVEIRQICISTSEVLKLVSSEIVVEEPQPSLIEAPSAPAPLFGEVLSEDQAPVVLPVMKLPPLTVSDHPRSCKSCAKIFHLRGSWLTREESSFQPSISFRSNVRKMLHSAEGGCQFCRLQLTKLFRLGPISMSIVRVEVNWWKFWDGDYHSHDDWDDNSYSKDFRIRYLSAARETIADDYYITKPVTDDRVRTIASSTNSRESLAIAKNWIRTCLYSHTSCNRQASKSLQRPTRLIFLGVENSREMRIVEQEYISRSVKYMTLSHRWGDANRAQLTISNYSDFKQGISKEYLPKAFFDAMEMARRLGIFYLWIDCLCIIQDSSADWNHESSNIADIYAGSWCNLAATCAVDDRQSLHVERNPPEIEGCVIKDSLGEPFKVEGNDDGARAWDGYVKNAPLMSRAWVFQEVSSAPRTLHFGQDQMYWQCSTQKACEGSPSELNMSRKRYQPEIIPPVESFQGPPGWANIVHQYSSCQLTFPIKDKLVALSGIARKYGAEMDYLAGLWEPDVLLQLPWKLNNPQDPSARPTEYQAPSWSWTSINNEIRYNELAKKPRTTQMLAKLLDADIVLATDNAFGRLTDGALTIRGSLVKLEYKRPSSIHKGPILPGTTFNLLPRNIPVSVDLDFNDDLSEGMIYYCLPLYFDLLGKLRENVHCLVLEPTGNKGEYVRKGTMILGEKSMSSGAGVGVWDVVRFVGCCKEGEGDIGENLYEGKEGEGWGLPMFVVTIV